MSEVRLWAWSFGRLACGAALLGASQVAVASDFRFLGDEQLLDLGGSYTQIPEEQTEAGVIITGLDRWDAQTGQHLGRRATPIADNPLAFPGLNRGVAASGERDVALYALDSGLIIDVLTFDDKVGRLVRIPGRDLVVVSTERESERLSPVPRIPIRLPGGYIPPSEDPLVNFYDRLLAWYTWYIQSFVVIDASDGSVVWSLSLEAMDGKHNIQSTPSGNALIVTLTKSGGGSNPRAGFNCDAVWLLDPATGAELTMPIVSDDDAFFGKCLLDWERDRLWAFVRPGRLDRIDLENFSIESLDIESAAMIDIPMLADDAVFAVMADPEGERALHGWSREDGSALATIDGFRSVNSFNVIGGFFGGALEGQPSTGDGDLAYWWYEPVGAGDRVLLGRKNGALELWSMADGSLLRSIGVSAFNTTADVVKSSNGRWIALQLDSKLEIWDLETATLVVEAEVFPTYTSDQRTVAFSHDESEAYIFGTDGKLKVLDLESGEQKFALPDRTSAFVACGYSAGSDAVYLVRANGWIETQSLIGSRANTSARLEEADIKPLRFSSPDNRFLYLVRDAVKLYDPSDMTLRTLHTLEADADIAFGRIAANDSRLLLQEGGATSVSGSSVDLYDTSDGHSVSRVDSVSEDGIRVDASGLRFACLKADSHWYSNFSSVEIRDVATGALVNEIDLADRNPLDAQLSVGGAFLYVLDREGHLSRFDVATGLEQTKREVFPNSFQHPDILNLDTDEPREALAFVGESYLYLIDLPSMVPIAAKRLSDLGSGYDAHALVAPDQSRAILVGDYVAWEARIGSGDLKPLHVAPGSGPMSVASFDAVAGRYYKLYSSNDLISWKVPWLQFGGTGGELQLPIGFLGSSDIPEGTPVDWGGDFEIRRTPWFYNLETSTDPLDPLSRVFLVLAELRLE